jgi:hypothetical protein
MGISVPHICHSSRREIVILNLDFEKAFDKVEHHVILNMLQRKGFSSIWLGWINSILSFVLLRCYLMVSQEKPFIVREVFGRVILFHPFSVYW